jgi:hypothetical protein
MPGVLGAQSDSRIISLQRLRIVTELIIPALIATNNAVASRTGQETDMLYDLYQAAEAASGNDLPLRKWDLDVSGTFWWYG